MRMKFVRNGRTKRRELMVATQRGEELDRKRATWLAEEGDALLLGFTFEAQHGMALLHYDVEGLWSLRTYLSKRSMSYEELLGPLEVLQQLLDLCAEHRIPTEMLLFDPEYVFVDTQCYARFVMLPLEELPLQRRNSPLALLHALGNVDGLKFASPDAEGLSRRLAQFLIELNEVFSANRFRRFLENEERQAGRDAAQEPDEGEAPGTSTWAAAGTGTGVQAAGGSALFWSPLAGLVEEEPEPVAEPVPAVPKQREMTFSDYEDAKDWLVEQFGISRTKLRSTAAIEAAAAQNNIKLVIDK